MLSVLSSFLLQDIPKLGGKRVPLDTYFDPQTLQALVQMLMMLLEILNSSKEIYVCLYVILPLAAYAQNFPEFIKLCEEQINVLVRKIL
jgi:hypothetical protein